MQKILYINEIDSIEKYIDKSVKDHINEGMTETFESFDNFDIIAFDWYDIENIFNAPAQIMVYIDSDDLFFLCENEMSYKKADAIFNPSETNERALYRFFRELFRGDRAYLEKLEDSIAEFDDEIIAGKIDHAHEKIVDFRKRLMQLKKYYEQLDDIFEELGNNDNELITDGCIRYFSILGNMASHYLASVRNMVESVTQAREAYQAQIDIEQNNIMKIFTIVTSIFLPLTLIVGWYGMNFAMPEFTWKYGYFMVIVLSVSVCVGLALYFKKKKWF